MGQGRRYRQKKHGGDFCHRLADRRGHAGASVRIFGHTRTEFQRQTFGGTDFYSFHYRYRSRTCSSGGRFADKMAFEAARYQYHGAVSDFLISDVHCKPRDDISESVYLRAYANGTHNVGIRSGGRNIHFQIFYRAYNRVGFRACRAFCRVYADSHSRYVYSDRAGKPQLRKTRHFRRGARGIFHRIRLFA